MSKINYQVDESLSILSEPPDIKNWFSSYTYESPVLDANEKFGDSPSVDKEEEVLCVEDSENEEDGNWRNSTRTSKMNESVIRRRITRSVIGKCNVGSRMQNHSPTVEVPAYQDSFSLISEPPDIRNWFPSYVYESPELDNAEFDTSLSREHNCGNIEEIENESKEIREDLRATDVKYESLFQKEAIPDSNAAIATSTRAKYSENSFVSQIPAYPDSPSLSSGPPDIRNLFPSYVYESPVLDSSDFDVLLSNQCHVGNIEELDEGKEVMEGLTQSNAKRKSSYLKEAIANSDVTMSNQVEYDTNQKDEVEEANSPSENLYSERTPEQMSEAEGTLALLLQEEQPMSSLHLASPLMAEKNLTEAEIEPGWVLPKQKSRISDDKTIKTKHTEPASAENRRCLATKKASSKTDENCPNKRGHEKCKCKIDVMKGCSRYNGDRDVLKREALNEITNFEHADKMEVAGKWRCPQRSKPVIGPPLKQLRLENWVRRRNSGLT